MLLFVSCVVKRAFALQTDLKCVCAASVQRVTAEPVCKFQSDLHVFPTVLMMAGWQVSGAGPMLTRFIHFPNDNRAQEHGLRKAPSSAAACLVSFQLIYSYEQLIEWSK